MAQRKYSMRLPLGTEVEITIPDPSLIAGANLLYRENLSAGWTFEDCLAMRALTSINGSPVQELGAALTLDTRDYMVLREAVTTLVAPSTEQVAASFKTLVLLDQPQDEQMVPTDGRASNGTPV